MLLSKIAMMHTHLSITLRVMKCFRASECYFGCNLEVYAVNNALIALGGRHFEFINGSGRNVTTGHWFTSIPLLESLNSNKLTLRCTIRKNKRELREEFSCPVESRPVQSSIFAFRVTLVS